MKSWLMLVAAGWFLAACGEGSPSSVGDGGLDDSCPLLEAPENGSVSQPNRAVGHTATYACDEGYSLGGNGGSDARNCLADFAWSGAPPVCVEDVADLCPALDAPESGSVDVPSRAFGEMAIYGCDEGHSLVGDGSRVCLASLTWSGTPPACVLDECPALDAPESGAVAHPSRVPGASATYTCGQGYELVGEISRRCQESLVWSGAAPKCVVPRSCEAPGETSQTWVISSLRMPADDEVIGFDLDGHYTMTEVDPVGCGRIDHAGGLDNTLPELFWLLTSLDGYGEDRFAAAVADGSIALSVEMIGYDGPDDESVLVSLFSAGAPIPGAQDLCVGSSPDGRVRVSFPSLSLTLPDMHVQGMDTYPLTIAMTEVLLEIENPAATHSSAVIGGRVLWHDGGGNGLYGDVQAVVDAVLAGVDIEPIVGSMLDLGPPGACDSFSSGMSATLSPAIQ